MNKKPLDQNKAVEVALGLFPRLYYFVPPIVPFHSRVLPNQVKVAGTSWIEIKEPLDSIIWLLETLAAEQNASGEACCFQPDLYNLIQRLTGWDRSKFTDELNKLLYTGIIDSKRRTDGDRRSNKLTLTPKGKKVLSDIKKQRVGVITILFQGLTAEQLETMVLALGTMADGMWNKMRLYRANQATGRSRASKAPSRKAGQAKK